MLQKHSSNTNRLSSLSKWISYNTSLSIPIASRNILLNLPKNPNQKNDFCHAPRSSSNLGHLGLSSSIPRCFTEMHRGAPPATASFAMDSHDQHLRLYPEIDEHLAQITKHLSYAPSEICCSVSMLLHLNWLHSEWAYTVASYSILQ